MLNQDKKYLLIITSILLIVTLVGCGGSTSNGSASGTSTSTSSGGGGGTGAAPTEKVYLNMATGPSTGLYYPLGTAIAQIWNNNIDNIMVTAQASNAGAHNIILMDKGDADIGLVVEGVTYYAVEGINEFDGTPHPNLRAVAYIFSSVDHFIARKGSGLQSLADLKGKRFVPGGMASGAEITAREIFKHFDLDYIDRKDVSCEFVNFDGAVERMKNEQTDAALVFSGVPTAAVLDLISSSGAYLLPIEPDKVEQITKDMPYYSPYVIKSGSYPNQNEDVLTVCQESWILVDESLDEELVYQMTKLLYEKNDELVNSHAAARNITLENTGNAAEFTPAPFHDGALRYYKEAGLY